MARGMSTEPAKTSGFHDEVAANKHVNRIHSQYGVVCFGTCSSGGLWVESCGVTADEARGRHLEAVDCGGRSDKASRLSKLT